jgi:hypothetical protein
MTTYRIVDWEKHYEVDAHGRPWEPGQGFRKGPLFYIRVKPRRDWNIRLLELHDLCGEQMWMAVGVFEKLCQVVGCEPRVNRVDGIIRNSRGLPATDEDIARMLTLEPETWRDLAATLCHPHVQWLALEPAEPAVPLVPPPGEVPGIPANPGSLPEIPAAPGLALSYQDKTRQVKTLQRNTEQDKTRPGPQEPVRSEGLAPIAGFLGRLVPTLIHSKELDGAAREVLDSTRLGFLCEMRRTLRAEERVEARTVSNFEQWVYDHVSSGRAGPELRQESLRIARGCVYGNKPVAVFLSRARKELGYVAPSRRRAASEDVKA